jgi:hypothetical protein
VRYLDQKLATVGKADCGITIPMILKHVYFRFAQALPFED